MWGEITVDDDDKNCGSDGIFSFALRLCGTFARRKTFKNLVTVGGTKLIFVYAELKQFGSQVLEFEDL
jgi:hypothetical protein